MDNRNISRNVDIWFSSNGLAKEVFASYVCHGIQITKETVKHGAPRDTTLGQARYIFNSIDPTPDLIAKAGICECPTTVPALEKNPFGQ
jgi:hypothetical protein